MENKLQDEIFEGLDGLDFGDVNVPVKNNVTVIKQKINVSQPIGNIMALAKSGYAKLKLMEVEMNDLYLERTEVIKDMLRAIIIEQSLLMLGVPGTGKTALAHEISLRITDAKFFSWLLNKTSDPAELLGPYSIKDMEKDKFRRKTEGKLPEAHIALIDECYKSNEPTLNILLPILNEKIFFNDGMEVPIPLITMFLASNEPPEDDSLAALHDRILFRHNVKPIQDPSNIEKMFDNYLERRNGVSTKTYTTISMEELGAMSERSKKVIVGKNIQKALIKLLSTMNREAVNVSERRKNECLKVLQGNAVMYDRDEVVLDDFEALIYVLWEKEEHISVIQAEIAKIVNPYDDKLRTLTRNFKEIKTNLDGIRDANDKCRSSIEAKGALESIVTKFEAIINEANKNGKDTTAMVETKAEIIKYNQKIMEEALGINFSATGMESPF